MNHISFLGTIVIMACLGGCASPPRIDPELLSIAQEKLPTPNTILNIIGLGPCTYNPDRSLALDSHSPVTVLVHGCNGSAGLFRGLAQVLAFHGQQTACFSYNDRDDLMLSSGQLTAALDQLAQALNHSPVAIIGHSQGALLARKAVVAERPDALPEEGSPLRLVTVSGPFSGIASASPCGNLYTQIFSLGLLGLSCKIATGDKWNDITYNSPFITQPGTLHPRVGSYLKIDSDERNTCRQEKDGVCLESDDVFSLSEQRHALIDKDPRATVSVVQAGHVEIVGDERIAPVKLIALLQEHGIIRETAPEHQAALQLLLTEVYGAPGRF